MLTSKEQKADQQTMKIEHMAHDALHDLIHFDSKLFRTLPALIFKPGKVTEKSLQPGQSTYVRPFALFVFLNFIFFVVKSKGLFQYTLDTYKGDYPTLIGQKVREWHISPAILKERFNTAMSFEQKEYFVVMVPLFAIVVLLIFLGKTRSYAASLVLALNFYSFLVIFLIVMPYLLIPVAWMIERVHLNFDLFYSEGALVFLVLTTSFVYLAIAVRRIFRQAIWLSIVKAALLSCTTFGLIVYVYRPLLFFIVMHHIGD